MASSATVPGAFATGGGETVDDYIIREHCYLAKIANMEREVSQYKHMAIDVQTRFDEKFEKTSLRHAMVRNLALSPDVPYWVYATSNVIV